MPASFDDGPLFSGSPLTFYLDLRLEDAESSIAMLGASRILGEDGAISAELSAKLTEAVSRDYRVEPLKFDFESAQRTAITEAQGVLSMSVMWPFAGDPDLLLYKINHTMMSTVGDLRAAVVRAQSAGAAHQLVFWVRSPRLDKEAAALIADCKAWLTSKVNFVNQVTHTWNTKMTARIGQAVAARAALLERIDHAERAMSIPVMKRNDAPISLPLQRRTLSSPAHAEPGATESGTPDQTKWILEDAAYEEVVRTLELFATGAGRLPASAGKLTENEFRNFALIVLNANFDFTGARGEVFNGKGKTDLLVPWEGGNAFIGEFKKFDGAESVSGALTQLLGYVTWADTKAALVIIIDRKDVTNALSEMHRAVEEHPAHQETLPSRHQTQRRDYVVANLRDEAQMVRLAVVPIVVESTSSPDGSVAGS